MTHLPSARRNTLTLAAACLASLMFGLEISSVPVILPLLEAALHGSFRDLQWIMNAYTIACTTVLMATGTLADRYGRKRIFLICVFLFGVTSLVCGLAGSTALLIAGRFLQGMAGGAMLVCQFAVLSQQFADATARAKAFGIWGIVFGIGLGFGPIIGAGIVALWSWEWVFLVHVPISAIALGLALVGVEESRDPQRRRLDVAGIVSLSVAVLALAWFITQGPVAGFGSVSSLASLIIAIGSCVAFVVAERRAEAPMFDFSVFRIRDFSGALLGSMGMNFSFWPLMIYLPLLFQHGLGYGNVATGLSLLAYTLPTLVLPPLGERLALRYRAHTVIPAGLFAIGAGLLLMAWGSGTVRASWLTMLPGCLLAGTGLGIVNTPVTNTITASVCVARTGMASGMDTSARLISLAINIAVMGFILVEGVLSFLRRTLPTADATLLRGLAERLSGGTAHAAGQGLSTPTVPPDVAAAAMIQGMQWVMLYGGISVWTLALCSVIVFGRCGAEHRSAVSKEVA
ncbi:MFS transporter [uncultured Xanthomonas sp.]|uniref:MFS transporter n=1 Tax=uncultured Xanthomonas sp. TaxID=152831 RepID=UPI0025DD5F76|nr:MFS transporter [uncultured Xanthomonas sp.]